ncbi:unnamed protein product [Closterium sp. Yama58-4]|nr:unnamed protein product [Closterium sp. Yama58-4]
MDVWGPARVQGQGREQYILLVVDNNTRYTTVVPLHSTGEVPDVLIPWIRARHLQLRKRFRTDHPVMRLHSNRGGVFSSDLLWDFCHGKGILLSFTLPASPQQNGVAERRIGLVMEPRVSLPETSPTLRWTGEVGDASVFRVWGARAFVRDTFVDKLSSHAILCAFLGFPPDAPGWQFYHPTSRRVLSSQDVTFDESVPFYHLFPYRTAPLPPLPRFLTPGPPPVDSLPPLGSCSFRGPSLRECAEPGGAEPGGTEPGGAEPGGVEPGGAEPAGAEPGGAESWGAEPRGTASTLREPRSSQQLREWYTQHCRLRSGAAGAGGPGAASPRGARGTTRGAGGTGGARVVNPGGARTGGTGAAGAGGAASTGGAGTASPGGARTGGTAAGDAGAGGTMELELLVSKVLVWEVLELPELVVLLVLEVLVVLALLVPEVLVLEVLELSELVALRALELEAPALEALELLALALELLELEALELEALELEVLELLEELELLILILEVLSLPSSTGLPLQPGSPLPAPSPYTEQADSIRERREPASRPASPVRAGRTGSRVPRPRPPPVPDNLSFLCSTACPPAVSSCVLSSAR